MDENIKIGFMQGRFLPLINGRIQAFPRENWEDEFILSNKFNFHLMEWTLDQDFLYENPLLSEVGQARILELCNYYNIHISSLTGDCFMQAPLWKANDLVSAKLKQDFCEIIKACSKIGIDFLVIPLVDNGRLEDLTQENNLIAFLKSKINFIASYNVKIIFESDYTPDNLARFIDRLDPLLFGINYDIGNSAALGFNSNDEFSAYGSRIMNVHIKDRLLNGTTVPLGEGNANFEDVFKGLSKINYKGNFILQTARSSNGKHSDVLCAYRKMVVNWIKTYEI